MLNILDLFRAIINLTSKEIMKNYFTIFILVFATVLYSQTNSPKREFRGAWVATVANLDWPSSPNLSTEDQKAAFISMLDKLKNAGINAIVFQVRPECDALYNSNYEPWSYWLTGSQGTPPSPYYDPLEFAVEECHKRGMELHAWFNPYRAVRSVGSYSLASNHVSVQHPDWIIQIGSLKFLDPGIPAVRQFVTDVIMDVVNRYDVDGVHFDDYFYPYPPNQITNQDDATFASYPNGFSNRADWRRNNVNLLVKMVNDSIFQSKPWVKFGISPFGIWRPGYPSGITGMDAYSSIYCDALAWLDAKTVDYLTPQLYWPIGGSQDYSKLMPWWADQLNGRHLYPGHGLYRAGDWSASEMENQVRLNRAEADCDGSVYFRAGNITANTAGFADSLKNDLYRYPSLMPVMEWKDQIVPNSPQNIAFKKLEGKGIAGLVWDSPVEALDGETASQYVVYNFYSGTGPQDYENPENINAISVSNFSIPARGDDQSPKYFSISALDRIQNESDPSVIIEISSPEIPDLNLPADGTEDLPDTVKLIWRYAENASFYDVQISTDQTFSNIDFEETNIEDTVLSFSGLSGLTTYYWRVRSANAIGETAYSNSFSFTTGFPATPSMVYPQDQTLDVPLEPTIFWNKADGAGSYRIQLNKSLSFLESSNVLDTAGIADTLLTLPKLEESKIYFLRVSADNQIGWSGWSMVYRFKTEKLIGVEEEEVIPQKFGLEQNYPNPFNPSTNINFTLPESGFVTLKVYDVLGREIRVLVSDTLNSGKHTIKFNGTGLNSGLYIYVLTQGSRTQSRKMMLVK